MTGRGWGAETPEGLRYQSGLIDLDEEQDLIARIETLALTPYVFRGVEALRKTIAFGARYGPGPSAAATSFPAWLEPLRARAAAFADVPVEALGQALVTAYPLGAGIGWHRDRPVYDRIIGVSLASDCVIRLRRREEDVWERSGFLAEARSIYVLDGAVRHLWEHSITPGKALRYSATFRTARSR